MNKSNTTHGQVELIIQSPYVDKVIHVDKGLESLILNLHKIGLFTSYSCIGDPTNGGYVLFKTDLTLEQQGFAIQMVKNSFKPCYVISEVTEILKDATAISVRQRHKNMSTQIFGFAFCIRWFYSIESLIEHARTSCIYDINDDISYLIKQTYN